MRKKLWKRTLAFLLALALFCAVAPGLALPASADALYGTCGDNLNWILSLDINSLTISGSGDMEDYTAYGPWYSPNNPYRVQELTLPYHMTSVGDFAFWGCSGLTGVDFSPELKEIGQSAFAYSGMTSVLLQDGLEILGARAFQDCWHLRSVRLSPNTPIIQSETFKNCAELSTVRVPYGVTDIEDHAFEGCSGLTTLTLPATMERIGVGAFQGCESLEEAAIPFGAESIDDDAFLNCAALSKLTVYSRDCVLGNAQGGGTGDLGLPAQTTIYGYSGSAAEQYAQAHGNPFVALDGVVYTGTCGEHLTWTLSADTCELVIEGYGQMDNYYTLTAPWQDCLPLIRSVSLPDGLLHIGNQAFHGCSNLTSVRFPEGLETIGRFAFDRCVSLTSATLPAGLKTIESYAFEYSGLTSVSLPEGLETIESHAFYQCTDLNSISFPAGLETIGNYAFYQCTGLTTVVFADGPKTIGERAFYQCTALRSLSIPEGLESLGYEAFSGCTGLTSASLPEGLKILKQHTFSYCASLSSVSLPEGLEVLEQGVFSSCTGLTSVVLPEGLQTLGDGVFFRCTGLTSVVFPEGLKQIGKTDFYGCTGLSSVVLPEGLETIGRGSFENCTGLRSVVFPANLELIDESAFYGCTGLTSLELPEGLKTIASNAFRCCTGLRSVTFPEGLETIGTFAFLECSSLSSVDFPKGISAIEEFTFYGCTSLSSVSIPANVHSIGSYAFSNCSGLKELTVHDPNCAIGQYSYTFGYPEQTILYGYIGSTTEQFAKRFRFTFRPLYLDFADVDPSAWYALPVAWAYENGITSGTGEASFSPNKPCTREQIMTMLWRACDAPEPAGTENPFTDVKADAYYEAPVLWAYYHNPQITAGSAAGTFGVGQTCTRAQVMTFLWAAAGKPEPTTAENPFEDVSMTDYYYRAVLWAVENGITSGTTPTTFSPNTSCTRAQVVTFLYKALG